MVMPSPTVELLSKRAGHGNWGSESGRGFHDTLQTEVAGPLTAPGQSFPIAELSSLERLQVHPLEPSSLRPWLDQQLLGLSLKVVENGFD